MNVLGIGGSPRIGGNTDILLDKALEGSRSKGADTEKIILNQLKFSPCQECDNKPNDRSCIIEDDMQLVYKKIEAADVVILASPIFFGSLSAQTKMMIDRFQCYWRVRNMLRMKAETSSEKKKKGIFISVEATTRKDFFDNAKAIVKNFFATIDTAYSGELFCPGIDEKAKILGHPDILKEAFELGQRVVSEKIKEA